MRLNDLFSVSSCTHRHRSALSSFLFLLSNCILLLLPRAHLKRLKCSCHPYKRFLCAHKCSSVIWVCACVTYHWATWIQSTHIERGEEKVFRRKRVKKKIQCEYRRKRPLVACNLLEEEKQKEMQQKNSLLPDKQCFCAAVSFSRTHDHFYSRWLCLTFILFRWSRDRGDIQLYSSFKVSLVPLFYFFCLLSYT